MTLQSAADDATRVLIGLIGRGILASRSPSMHENEADAQGLRLVYSLFDFDALGLADGDLPRMLDALELAGFSGVNITHPYKQAVMAHVGTLGPDARRAGAVNTVSFRDGERLGDNTDVGGFARALAETLGSAPMDKVVQVGAGGGGAAVACALLDSGVGHLIIHDIEHSRADTLVKRLASHYSDATVAVGRRLAVDLATAAGVVNATPAGMIGHPGTAIPIATLRPDLWVADIVYFPLVTSLLAAARSLGSRVMDGSGMAIHQAAGAFEIFAGRPADPIRMRRTFESFDRADHDRGRHR